MKKKTTLAITLVALVAVAIIGGTLAWFTDSESVTNKIKTGKLDVTLTEPNYTVKDGSYAELVVPGKTFTKDPTITNNGTVATKVRYQVLVSFTDNSTLSLKGLSFTKLGADSTANVITDYKDMPNTKDNFSSVIVLQPGESFHIFDQVNIPEAWDNAYMNKELNITVNVQALQADKTYEVDWKNITFEKVTTPVVTE